MAERGREREGERERGREREREKERVYYYTRGFNDTIQVLRTTIKVGSTY